MPRIILNLQRAAHIIIMIVPVKHRIKVVPESKFPVFNLVKG